MIKLENLTKKFPGLERPAVDHLNLEIEDGDICVLVGPSGCGKTTTLKMINRLHEPDGGEIYLNGEPTSELDEIELRRGIGYVIQEIGLFPHMSIMENISTVPRELDWPEDRIEERVEKLMEMVGLDPDIYWGRLPAALSGGQRQRVGVARALAADPPVLLMDEPFGAVDPITRASLQNEFLRLQDQMDKTIVFVTHDINEAIKMGDKVAVLKEGKLVQYSSPQELLDAPADEFVAQLVGKNRSIKRLHLIRVEEIVEEEQEEITVVRNCSREEMEKTLEKCADDVLCVVDENGCLLGRIDKEALREEGECAEDLMDEFSETVTADSTLNDALSVMLECGEGFVPVIDEEIGKFHDVITLQDLLEEVREGK